MIVKGLRSALGLLSSFTRPSDGKLKHMARNSGADGGHFMPDCATSFMPAAICSGLSRYSAADQASELVPFGTVPFWLTHLCPNMLIMLTQSASVTVFEARRIAELDVDGFAGEVLSALLCGVTLRNAERCLFGEAEPSPAGMAF